jgi:L-threonylcarbamoyladenylate synthase
MASPFDSDIIACIEVLEKGGLILYPTDTIWGIGCDATNATAVEKVYKLKKRPDEKSMIVLLPDEKDILRYITQPYPRISDYIKGMEKPTTVIYEGAIGFAENLIPPDGTIAIRVVKDDFCRQLIKRYGKPIVSTSANVSGYPPPPVFADIDVVIKDGVDYIVQHRQDDTAPAQPSSIIKWNADGSLTIIRS